MENEAVLRLFDMYADDMFRLAYSYLGSRQEAEDVVQDVFLKLIRSDIAITKGKEKTYLLTMTANASRDVLKSGRIVFIEPFDDAIEAGTDDTNDGDDGDTEMLAAVAELPEKLRIATHLHYYEGYSVKEIAKIMGKSKLAVSQYLSRGRRELRKKMEEDGIYGAKAGEIYE